MPIVLAAATRLAAASPALESGDDTMDLLSVGLTLAFL